MGGLIREAIEARFAGASPAQRMQAAEEIAGMRGARFIPPEELDRIAAEERETELERFHAPDLPS